MPKNPDPNDPKFLPGTFEKPDVHDTISGDQLSWQPAEVLDIPETGAEVLDVMGYWQDRHQILDATEDILIAFSETDVGKTWLRLQGWRFGDLTPGHATLLFMRRQTYEHMSPDLKEAWSDQFEAASDSARTVLRDWRQELRKCAMWVLAGDPLDALKISAFTLAEYGEHASYDLVRTSKELTESMRRVSGAVDDADWLLESYVMLSSVADIDGLFHHQKPNKVLAPHEPVTLTTDDKELS